VTEPDLAVRVDRSGEDPPRALAPAVGWWIEPPPPGTVVGPGSSVGHLRCLNRLFRLIVPKGIAGTVERAAGSRVTEVGFGDVLFHLRPLIEAVDADPHGAPAGPRSPGNDLPEGTSAVCAPTDGVFYRRPSPEAPPFVEIGGRVRTGQPVGLVEVMKTFNQIVYGGPGMPDEVEVVEIRCEDGAEVGAGQPLVIVR
jgi:biotin carboxyl carrier protein